MKFVDEQIITCKISNPLNSLEYHQFRLAEAVGRICYRSEGKITGDSWKPFIKNLIKRGHYSVLEHANFNFVLTGNICTDLLVQLGNLPAIKVFKQDKNCYYVTMNCRNAIELAQNKIEDTFLREICKCYELDYKEYFPNFEKEENNKYLKIRMTSSVPDEFKKKATFATISFQIPRGIWDELARHRDNACMCESSRYCMYAGEQFNNEICFYEPDWLKKAPWFIKYLWKRHLKSTEKLYRFVSKFTQAQFVRGILPLDYSVQCAVTASLEQWDHILDMRLSKAAHPDMRKIMIDVYMELRGKYPNLMNFRP